VNETRNEEITAEQRAVVDRLLRRRDLPPRVRERLEMVKAAALGQDLATIAAWSGRTVRTVKRWLRRYGAGGVAAVADAPRAGRPPRADAAYRQALERAVDTPPRDLGLPFDVWTSARLSAYLAQITGVRIAPGWLRVLLAQQDFACGRPKHTLGHLQDPAAVAACEVELAAAEKKGGRRARALRDALPGRDAHGDEPVHL
jgi:transposase